MPHGSADTVRRGAFFLILFAILLAARLCHLDILWADEDYHLAAAIQVIHGKALYREFWYDKPPLSAYIPLLWGAQTGWPLRIASAAFALLLSGLSFLFASRLWTRREGYWAAALMAFSLIFYFPGATLTLEPDTLMIAPHLAAIYCAWRGRAKTAGILAGIAMLVNVKGAFVLLACAFFLRNAWQPLLIGFAIPNGLLLAWLAISRSVADYIQQVWRWGLLYSAGAEPVQLGVFRAVNWFGFHAALVMGAAWWFLRRDRKEIGWLAWLCLSLVAAGIGWRFLPRYMDQLLPPLVVLSARGWVLLYESRRTIAVALIAVALLVPAIRFGPRYVVLASEIWANKPHEWKDVALDLDSRAAARAIHQLARPGDTIMVWGYRPNVVAYTRLPVAGKFWDSQPLTGVPADRHLATSKPVAEDWARRNRSALLASRPTYIADGLSLLNPALDMRHYPEIASWLNAYCAITRTSETVIYRRCRP